MALLPASTLQSVLEDSILEAPSRSSATNLSRSSATNLIFSVWFCWFIRANIQQIQNRTSGQRNRSKSVSRPESTFPPSFPRHPGPAQGQPKCSSSRSSETFQNWRRDLLRERHQGAQLTPRDEHSQDRNPQVGQTIDRPPSKALECSRNRWWRRPYGYTKPPSSTFNEFPHDGAWTGGGGGGRTRRPGPPRHPPAPQQFPQLW